MSNDTPAPPAASAIMNDTLAPAPADHLAILRASASAQIEAFKGRPGVAEMLARGDPYARHELARLEAVARMPSQQVPGAAQTEAEAEQHQQGWNAFMGATMADIYGANLGAQIEKEMKESTPITPAEFRQAKAVIAEMKSSEEDQKALRAGSPRVRARWSLAHNMITRPIKME